MSPENTSPVTNPRPNPRRAGILLHVTSLPGRFGIGDLGPSAETFLSWLAASGQRLWQVLPLGPTGYGDSPYGCHSSLAGNPLLISPELLLTDGLLTPEELKAAELPEEDRVPFAEVKRRKDELLRRAYTRCRAGAGAASEGPDELTGCDWLDGWCLYAALKSRHGGRAWFDWEPSLRRREAAAIDAAGRELQDEMGFQRFCQRIFRRQWRRLRRLAAELDIAILGDLPIYPAADSADVWLARELFELDEAGQPLAVAGVPPDYFSQTGQLWGNPVYRWDRHREQGFSWWIERIRGNLDLFDRLRLDHFRGFEAFWRVPRSAKTAAAGSWSPGPGEMLFVALKEAVGEQLPLVAEDLGVITPEVEALLEVARLPRMKVLQFGFGEVNSQHLPHHHHSNAVVYTGTHDNDTTLGWFARAPREERRRCLEYLDLASSRGIARSFLRAAYLSVAETAIAPMQDVLELGSGARMNAPGAGQGNWGWRMRSSGLTPESALRLKRLAEISGRLTTATQEAAQNTHPG